MFSLILLFVAGGIPLLGVTVIAWLLGWLKWQRAVKVALFIVLFCLVNVPLTHYLSLTTIASDYKYGSYEGSQHWGYKLQYDRWENETELILWEGWSGSFRRTRYRMYLSYKYPTYFSPPTVKEARWLAEGEALYLDLGIKFDNSGNYEQPVRFIYDFHTGQTFATEYSSLWLVGQQTVKPAAEQADKRLLALTIEEFAQVLKDYEARKP